METMRKAPRLTNREDKGEEMLDGNLWGQLQEHIPLQTIYKKLSQQDLFRLRLVNKEWNHAALQWILLKPSFVTIHPLSRRNPSSNGIVTYNSTFGKFKFDHQHLHLHYAWSHVPILPPFEVEGLILCHDQNDLKERGVFNVHNQTWHAIPTGPKQSEALFACGLLVDTTLKPYTFKLVEGHFNYKTQIYDSESKSWSITSSQLPSSFINSWLFACKHSCLCDNNNIYMCVDRHMILKYSLEDDKWTKLNLPNGWDFKDNTWGIWAGKIFITTEDVEERRITVWELVDSEGQEWVEYTRMPKEQYEWLHIYEFDVYFDGLVCNRLYSRSFFRDGYMLVCDWRWDTSYAKMLTLFDIATKSWQNVDLPS